jgi:ribosomal protein L22
MNDEAKDTQAQDAEEKPKRRRRTRAKSEGAAAEGKAEAASKRPRRTRAKAKAEEPKAEEATAEEPKAEGATAEEPKAEEARAEGDSTETPKPSPRRRGAADAPATPALVRAQAKYVRTSARKARLVCDHIRGKSVDEARAILQFTPRAVARDWSKLLESAVANAEHNHELVGDELRIKDAHADEGPTLKRYRPRAMGRATRIRKRTTHLSITLTPKETV